MASSAIKRSMLSVILLSCLVLSQLILPMQAASQSAGNEGSPQNGRSSDRKMLTGSVTLRECIDYALDNNPDVAAEFWNVSTADARSNLARSNRLPVLGVEGGYQRYVDPQRLIQATYNAEPGYFDSTLYQAGLVLRIPSYTGGRITSL